MRDIKFIQDFIQILRKLYFKVLLVIFHNRKNSYRNNISTSKNIDMNKTLLTQIEKLAATANINAEEKIPDSSHPEAAKESKNNSQYQSKHTEQATTPSTKEDTLSKYFKNHEIVEIYPKISDKLKQSALDHVHAALRLARNGDLSAAQLNAKIADNALKEAAHYLSDAEYYKFSQKISEEINRAQV